MGSAAVRTVGSPRLTPPLSAPGGGEGAFGPRLPGNAPFTRAQRAWLDGYVAGWFGCEGGRIAEAPPAQAEDFPWHDPALPIEDRLALAEGRPLQRVLMAAMAQLDCGQCGYLCQSYAEAIASGGESSLTRCVPGGKATSRKLKELIGGALTRQTAMALAVSPVGTTNSATDGPFSAVFHAAGRLNGPGSEKDIRHVLLANEDGRLKYEVGDSLGIRARNSAELVTAIIDRLGATPETPVLSPDGVERPLIEALAEKCEIRRPSDRAIEVLASRALNRDESMVLQAMAEGYPGAGPEDADLLDLLDGFTSARPPLSELISALDPLQPRLYSIASSPKHVPGELHLAVAAVRYEKRSRRRLGVASTYLADRVPPGGRVEVFVRPSPGFRLPASPDAPVIMIGPGTGIAPFRAFLQERRALGAPGRNWLFFGDQRRRCDFLFEEELAAYSRNGLLTRLDLAFSRDQPDKVYVQHRLLEHGAELWTWLQDGAFLYVCGDAARMARDVEAGLAYIVAKEGGMEPAAAKAYLARLAAEGRYQKDVY